MEATEPKTDEQIMEGLLIQEDTSAPDEDQTEDEAEEAEEEEATEQEADEESDEDDADAEEAEASDDDDSEQEADEQPSLYTVKVDGEERQVTLDELTRGYAGQSYIQKGMNEVSATKKKAEEVFNALSQERQQLTQLVQTLQETGLRQPTAPDIAMLQSDPIGYMEAKAKYDSELSEFNQKVSGIRQQQEQAQAAAQQAQQAYLAEQQELLAKALPDMTDPEKGPALQKKLRATGEAYGFADNEIAGITDARMVQVLHDAMRYRDTMAKKEEVTKKAAKARPVAKAGAKKAQESAKQRTAKLRQRARQGDESAVLELLLEPKGS